MLTRMLTSYYQHVCHYKNSLVTKFLGVHCVKPIGGQKVGMNLPYLNFAFHWFTVSVYLQQLTTISTLVNYIVENRLGLL